MTEEIFSHYSYLEKKIQIRELKDNVTYTSPVNFTESMSLPRHRWYPYKEGFSPEFVKDFLNKYSDECSGRIFDPFSGVGTTALTSATIGFDAIGFDVSPLANFIAKTKSFNLNDVEKKYLDEEISLFSRSRLKEKSNPPENETVRSYFEKSYFDAILKVMYFIQNIENIKIKDLFKLSTLSLVEFFSTHRRAGNGVKKKTKYGYIGSDPINEVKQKTIELLKIIQEDINNSVIDNEATFYERSAIELSSYNDLGSISAVITSPPYANCFDYSKIYMRELWIGGFFSSVSDQKEFRKKSLRSHVHATWEPRNDEYGLKIVDENIKNIIDSQKMWSAKIGGMLSGYFKDIHKTLELMKPHLGIGAPVGFVVSNSFYGGVTIATDLLIAEIAEKIGYKVEEIIVYRRMVPSSQQFKKIGENNYMRESLVVFRNV